MQKTFVRNVKIVSWKEILKLSNGSCSAASAT